LADGKRRGRSIAPEILKEVAWMAERIGRGSFVRDEDSGTVINVVLLNPI